jgi:hypothetical protein
MAMGREGAEVLALQALGWIAADEGRLGAFLAASGAGLDEVRARAADPAFLGAVLDALLADERAVRAFCADSGVPLDAPLAARAALPGGDLPHWT